MDAVSLLHGVSIEITAKDISALEAAKPHLPPGTPVSITYLAHETHEARIAAAAAVRRLGFTPAPHISARRLLSQSHLDDVLSAFREAAGVERVFVIAGDMADVKGPYPDSLSVIRSGRLGAHGLRAVGIAGHPGGHGHVPEPVLQQALEDKASALRELGLQGEIVTQFAFEAGLVLAWLERLRGTGVELPVRIGLPGPASMATLLRFAARCGVETSSKVLAKYGFSVGRLIGSAGPERMLDALAAGLSPQTHGLVGAHLYSFGGLLRTAEWIEAHLCPTSADA